MNNKGFTLVELILVVFVLSVITTIITITLTKTLKDTETKECNSWIEEIEDAACMYESLEENRCVDHNDCAFTLGELIDEGFIDGDKKNQCTKGAISREKTVIIEWNYDGEKHCTYHEG